METSLTPRPSARFRRCRGLSFRIVLLAGTALLLVALVAVVVVQYWRHHSPETLAARGRIALMHHNPGQALVFLQQARKAGPSKITLMQIRHMMAKAYLQTGRPGLARRYLDHCLRANPKDVGALQLYARSYVQPVLRATRRLRSPIRRADTRRLLAAVDRQLKDIQHARKPFAGSAYMLTAQGRLNHLYYAWYMQQQARLRLAVVHAKNSGVQTAYAQAVKRAAPWQATPQEREALAIKQLRQALAMDSTNASAAIHLAHAYFADGKYAAGAALARQMLARKAATAAVVIDGAQCLQAQRQEVPSGRKRRAAARALLKAYLAQHPKDPAVETQLGALDLRDLNFARARARAQAALAGHPRDINANMLLAQTELTSHHPRAARAQIIKITNFAGHLPAVWWLLGLSDDQMHHYRRARHNYRKSLALQKDYPPALEAMMKSYGMSGKEGQAAQLANTIRVVDPTYIPAWALLVAQRQRNRLSLKNIRKQLDLLSTEAAFPEGRKPQLAELLLNLGETRQAARVLATLPPEMRNNAGTLEAQALLAQRAGHVNTAIADLRQAIARPSAPAALRVELARLLLSQGRSEDGRTELAAARQKAKSFFTFRSLAQTYLQLHMAQQALACANRALHYRPTSLAAQAIRHNAQVMLGQHAAAVHAQVAAIKTVPAAVNAAEIALGQHDDVGALAAANKGLTLSHSNALLLVLKARALALEGHRQQAGQALLQALVNHPSAPGIYKVAVDVFRGEKQPALAEAWAKKARNYDPAMSQWVLGQLAGVAGDYAHAQQCFNAGLKTALARHERQAQVLLFNGLLNVGISQHDTAGYREIINRMAKTRRLALAARLTAAQFFASAGNHAEAARQLRKAQAVVAAKKQPLAVVLTLARAWGSIGMPQQGLASLQGAPADPAVIGEKINLYQAQGNWAKALALCSVLAKDHPNNPGTLAQAAALEANLRQFPQAFATLKRCAALGASGKLLATMLRVKLYSALGLAGQAAKTLTAYGRTTKKTDFNAELGLGQLWLQLHQSAQAEAVLKDIPQYAPQYASAQVALAQLQLQAHHPRAAVQRLQKVAAMPGIGVAVQQPLFSALLAAGDAMPAYTLAMRNRAVILPGTGAWLQWTFKAVEAARKAGRLKTACTLLATLEHGPAGAQAATDLALLQLLRNNLPQARSALRYIPPHLLATQPAFIAVRLLALRGTPQAAAATSAFRTAAANMPYEAGFVPALAMLADMPPKSWSSQLHTPAIANSMPAAQAQAIVAAMLSSAQPQNAMAALALAQELYAVSWRRAALTKLQEVQQLAPACPQTPLLKYAAAVALGQKKAAASALAILQSRYSQYPPTRAIMARTAAQHKHWKKAIAQYRALVASTPNNPQYQITLAEMYRRAGQLQQALQLDLSLRKKFPSLPAIANNLAYTLAVAYPHDAARLKQAQQQINWAVQQQPGEAGYLDTQGWIELLRGHPHKAYAALSAAIRPLRTVPQVHYHIGLDYAKLGHKRLARLHLQNAIALAGGKDPALASLAHKALAQVK